jgi:hypothetical protein
MMENLIRMYEKGAITAYQLMIDCLHMIDPQSPWLSFACASGLCIAVNNPA